MPHVCLQHLLGGPTSEPNPLRYTDFASSEQSIPSFSSPPPTRSHSKPIARKFQNGFLQEAVSKTLRRSAFPPARASPRRSVPDTALTLNAVDNTDCRCTDRRTGSLSEWPTIRSEQPSADASAFIGTDLSNFRKDNRGRKRPLTLKPVTQLQMRLPPRPHRAQSL